MAGQGHKLFGMGAGLAAALCLALQGPGPTAQGATPAGPHERTPAAASTQLAAVSLAAASKPNSLLAAPKRELHSPGLNAPGLQPLSSADTLLEAVILTALYTPQLVHLLISTADGIYFSYGLRHVGTLQSSATSLNSLDLGISYHLDDRTALNLRVRGSAPQLQTFDVYMGIERYAPDGVLFFGPYTGLGALTLPRTATSKGLDTFAALWGVRIGTDLKGPVRVGVDASVYLDFAAPWIVHAPALMGWVELGCCKPGD